jgi:uncharacterized protein YkwD
VCHNYAYNSAIYISRMLKHRSPIVASLAFVFATTACGAQIKVTKDNITPVVIYPPTASLGVNLSGNDSEVDEIDTPVAFVTAVVFATIQPAQPIAVATPISIATVPPIKSVAKAQPTSTPAPTANPILSSPSIALASLPTAPPIVAANALPTAVNLRMLPTVPPLTSLNQASPMLLPSPTALQGQFPKSAVGLENVIGGSNPNQIAAMRDHLMVQSNSVRAMAGLPPLQFSPVLQLAAQQHADECSQLNRCGHVGADGSSTQQRLRRVGYVNDAVGENWAWARNVPAAWDMWFTQEYPSGPHRNNILSRFYREAGFGIAAANGGFYFITNFGGSFK